MEEKLDFKKGLYEGVPIALGYLGPSIAIAVLYVASGFDKLFTSFLGVGLYTISGMGALLNLFSAGVAEPLKYAAIIFLVNCRYIILSLTLGQKLDPKTSTLKRMAFSFFHTDEVFGFAMQKPGKLPIDYMFGLVTVPYTCQFIGIFLGAVLGNIIPASIKSALGIVLCAMFVSIVVSSTKKSAPVANTVIIAVVISWALEGVLPQLNIKIEESLVIFICAMSSALISAIIFPVKDTKEVVEEVEMPKEVD